MSDSDSGLLSDVRMTIARREIASLSREKTIVLALLIQLFIAAFSSFLVVGLTSLYDPGSVEGEGIRVGVSGEVQDKLNRTAAETEGVTAVGYETQADALAGFNRGEIDAVLTGSRAPTANGSRLDVVAIVPEENIRTTLIVVQVRELLTELERTERQQRAVHLSYTPRDIPEDVDASPYFGFTYTVLIPLLLFLPPFISGSIAVDAITEEIERGTLELLRVAPVSLVDIVDGKALGMIALAPLQAILWIFLLGINNIAVQNVLPLVVFVTAAATIVVGLGTVLGLVTARRRQAQLLYSLLVILLFGAAIALPEHPATTVAKLAVDSPTLGTYAHVAGLALAAAVAYGALRRYTASIDIESL